MKSVRSNCTRMSLGVCLVLAALLFPSCRRAAHDSSPRQRRLIVFNAGSLAAPVADLLNEFGRLHPGIAPQQESSGSLEAARKITELGKPCDVLAVADHEVIPSLLMPQYANWYLIFARNELVLIYTPRSRFSDQINAENWHEVLLRSGVLYGYSDPNLDPAGYRTLLHWQLAETYYDQPGLYERLKSGVQAKNIRPKSVELVALLQAGELDYVYCYRSIAEQHKLPFIKFPADIDFSETDKAGFYATAETDVDASKPGEKMKVKGMPIRYGLTILNGAQDRELAEEFVEFLLSPEGQAIMQRKHLMTISPAQASDIDKAPARLRSRLVSMRGD